MIPTLAQTIYLLTFSRGTPPDALPAITRRCLLKRRWISPPAPYAITRAGRDALATSPFLAQAQRVVDGDVGSARSSR